MPPKERKRWSGSAPEPPSITKEQAAEMIRVLPGEVCYACEKAAIKAWPWPDGSFRMPLCRTHWPMRGRHGVAVDVIAEYYSGKVRENKTTIRRKGREDW